jgi:hypothetical protein
MYDSKLILEGKVPFQDFQARAPILIYALAIFTYFTNSSLISYYILTSVVNALTVYLLYAFTRRLMDEKIAVISAIVFGLSPILVFLLWLKTQTFLIPVILIALILYDKYLVENKKLYLFLSMLIVGLAFYIRESTVVYFTAFVGLIVVRSNSFKELFNKTSTLFTIFISLTVFYVIITMTFFTYSGFTVESKFLDFDNFEVDKNSIERLYYLPYYASHYMLYLFAGSIMLLFYPLYSLFKRRYDFYNYPIIVPFFAILSLTTIYLFNAYRLGFWPQYYMEFAVYVSMMAGALVYGLFKLKNSKILKLGAFTIFVILLLFSNFQGIVEMKEYKGAISRDGAIEISNYIKENTGSEVIIFAGSPIYSHLSFRSHFMNLSHEYYEPDYVELVTNNLIESPPKIIVHDGRVDSYYMDNEQFSQFLNENYIEVFNSTQFAYNRSWHVKVMSLKDENNFELDFEY